MSKIKPKNKRLITLAPFQLAIMASSEKINWLLSVFAISLPGSNNLNISTNELLIRLNVNEKKMTNKKIFHHFLEGVGGLKLLRTSVVLNRWVMVMPSITLIMMRSKKTKLICRSSTYAKRKIVSA